MRLCPIALSFLLLVREVPSRVEYALTLFALQVAGSVSMRHATKCKAEIVYVKPCLRLKERSHRQHQLTRDKQRAIIHAHKRKAPVSPQGRR
jgi:hypothetical protein